MHPLGDGLAWDWEQREQGVYVASIEAVLPGAIPSQNERERMNWRARARTDDEWRNLTTQLFGEALRRTGASRADLALPWTAVDIDLLFRFASPNARDVANFIGAAKPVIDALTVGKPAKPGLGLIRDDSYVYLDSVSARIQKRLEPSPSTIVRVTRCRH